MVDAALRIALAFVLVLPLGWEHERKRRSAGLRTYPLVAAAVCGFLVLARTSFADPSAQADVFYGVLSGIGFVGSGAIIKSPQRARGTSTAVTLWVAGAIGAGVAFGSIMLAIAVALISVIASWPKRKIA